MRRYTFLVAGLLAVALAHAQGSFTGQYRLHPSSDAVRTARVAGRSADDGRLTLRSNGRFLLEQDGAVRHGDYRVDGDRLTLYPEDGDRLRGEIRGDRIELEGLEYERGSSPETRRFPTDGATGRLDRVRDRDRRRDEEESHPALSVPAPVVAAPAPVVPEIVVPAARPAPVVVVPVAAPAVRPVPRFHTEDLIGGWTVHRDGSEVKGQRMELRKDGTFRFAMTGATSEGTWTLEEGQIVLVWTKIDGDVVEANSVKKCIPVSDDGSAFQIDTYRYERATDK